MIRFPLKILLNFFVSQKIISERRTEYLFAGSIFMDAYNNASFYNYNTIIYGHNMRDGSMFARLKELSNEATLRQCPYFWILTPDADYLYKICSIHQASSGSDTFTVRFADYLKAEDVKFTVKDTGEIQTVVMKDKPKKQPETTPTTEKPTTPDNPTNPTSPSTPTTSKETPKETPTTPKTGDDRNPLIWLLLLGIGGCMADA